MSDFLTQFAPALPEIFVLAMVSLILVIDAAVDDSKRTIVAGILRPGSQEPDLRSIPNEPRHLRRLFARTRLAKEEVNILRGILTAAQGAKQAAISARNPSAK